MVVSLATLLMVWAGMAGRGLLIYYGVLHCLGTCMILWPLCKKLPTWALLVLGLMMAVSGEFLRGESFTWATWLFPLGFKAPGFSSSDYFPLLPNLGFFLLGSILGRVLYRNKKTLFPQVDPQIPAIRFLGFCGRQSLFIYLLHQPVLSLVCLVLSLL
jgi:uncharacterized membrane protein